MAISPTRAVAQGTSSTAMLLRIGRLLIVIVVILLIGFGTRLVAWQELDPGEGAGYYLGIAGGTAMLVLLAYPLRKRWRLMDRLGGTPAWFRLHMLLGITGPILILYHSNFSLGSTNSNVALFSMLIVAGSGVIGRYFYGKIHNGLYGAKTDLQDLLGEATALLSEIENDVGGASGSIVAELTDFGTAAMKRRNALLPSLYGTVTLPFSSHFVRARILKLVGKAIQNNAASRMWSKEDNRIRYKLARNHVGAYLRAVVRAAELHFYERLFALWHVLHVPLFFLLIISGVAHVVAVHLY